MTVKSLLHFKSLPGSQVGVLTKEPHGVPIEPGPVLHHDWSAWLGHDLIYINTKENGSIYALALACNDLEMRNLFQPSFLRH